MNLKVNLGKTEDEQNFFVDFKKQHIHLTLLVGATGTGKSVLGYHTYQQLVSQNSPDEIGFVLLDNIRVEFSHWNQNSLYLVYPISMLEKALEVLEDLVSKLDEINKGNKHLFVHIEEMDLFALDYGRTKKALKQLLEHKDNSKIHIIFSTSRPSPDIFTEWLLSLVDMKIIGMMASSEGYTTITGKDYTVDFANSSGGEKFVLIGGTVAHLLPYTVEEVGLAENFKL